MSSKKLTEEDGRLALRDHLVDKALAARDASGGNFEQADLEAMLADPSIVRFPTTLVFDESALEPGEFAHAQPCGERPSDGFRLCVHPLLESHPALLPLAVAYHIVPINYGEIVTHEEAELFGATLLGMDQEDYYKTLCALADSLSADSTGGCPSEQVGRKP